MQIRLVHDAEDAISATKLFRSVWQGDEDVVPFDLILAAQHVGGYAAIAEQDGVAVAASFGFRGSFRNQQVLHSHVTASVIPGVGHALKMHQRDWAVASGLDAITWTFDPLVRRNCVFNFVKLGASAVEYLPNFYGDMTDSINRGDTSDRLFAYWPLAERSQVATAYSQVLISNLGGEPKVNEIDPKTPFLVQLPADIEALRQTDLGQALNWRAVVRDALLPAFQAGATIIGMDADRTGFIVKPAPHFPEEK